MESLNQGGFKYSTPQERFARQADIDIKRKTLSQSTIRKLINDETAVWARTIFAQKEAQNNAANTNQDQISQKKSTSLFFENEGNAEGSTSGSVSAVQGTPAFSSLASSSMTPIISGKSRGDILYWNGFKWDVFLRPSGNELRVLTIQGGELNWMATEDC